MKDLVFRLLARLETGALAPATDLCARLGTALNRGDYQTLAAAGCAETEQIAGRTDEELLDALGDTPAKCEKVQLLRQAVEEYQREQRGRDAATEPLPVYTE